MFKFTIVNDDDGVPMAMIGVKIYPDGVNSVSARTIDPNNFGESDALQMQEDVHAMCLIMADTVPFMYQNIAVMYKGYVVDLYAVVKLVSQMMIREMLHESPSLPKQLYVRTYNSKSDSYDPVGCVSFSGYNFGVSLLHPKDKSYEKSLARRLARQDGFEQSLSPKHINKKVRSKHSGKTLSIKEAVEIAYLHHFHIRD